MPVDPRVETALTWQREFAFRFCHHFTIKLVGTTAWIWVFFIGYFHLLAHVAYPVTTMPVTPLDALIPFVPGALLPYLSLWFYVGIAPGLQRSFRELLAYGFWSALLCGIGLAIFYRFPTQVPAFVFDRTDLPGFVLLQGIDAPGNACPSMHVAIALFTAVWLDVIFREMRMPGWARALNVAWFLVIVFSTVAVRQHVVIDVIGGALLGAAVAIPSLVWRPKGAGRSGAPATAAIIGGSSAVTRTVGSSVPHVGGATSAVSETTNDALSSAKTGTKTSVGGTAA
jgi:hypothetical protein